MDCGQPQPALCRAEAGGALEWLRAAWPGLGVVASSAAHATEMQFERTVNGGETWSL